MKYKKLYMNNNQKEQYKKNEQIDYLKKEKLNVKIIENGTILPANFDKSESPKLWAIGGVIDNKGHFVDESNSRYLFGGNYEYNEEFVKYIDEEVVFLGPFIKHWGHFICDQISRLWYILDNPNKYKVVYCGWDWWKEIDEISGNYMELLSLIGIRKENLINIKTPTRFKKIIIPDFSFIPGNYYTKEFLNITNKIVENNDISIKKCPKKIYFTRSQLLEQNKEKGEDQLIKLLKCNGYEIMAPEKLSFKEQIYYFNHAESIAMISGSIAHNLMFCNKKTEAIIFNKINLLNNYQMVIDHITGANIIYIDSYKMFFPVLFGAGPFILDINKYVKQYFKDNKSKIPKIKKDKLKTYLWYFKQYHNLYSKPEFKKTLKNQQESEKLKQNKKNQ